MPMKPHDRRAKTRALARGRVVAVLIAVLLVSGGCKTTTTTKADDDAPATTQPAAGPKRFPSLLEMRPMPGTAAAEVPPGAPARVVPIFVQRLDLPRADSLDRAWRTVDPGEISDQTLLLWRLNGIRIGTVPIEQYNQFLSTIPRPLRSLNGSLLTGDKMLPLQAWNVRHPEQGVRVARSASPNVQPQVMDLRGGQYQFLIRVAGLPDGRLRIELIPHLYAARSTIRVRDPSEVIQDGTVFRELTLQMDLPPDRMLVVAWDLAPWAAEPEENLQESAARSEKLPAARGERAELPPAPPIEAAAPATPPKTRTPGTEPRNDSTTPSSPAAEPIVVPAPPADAPRRLGDLILTQELGTPAQSMFILIGPGRPVSATQPSQPPTTQPATRPATAK